MDDFGPFMIRNWQSLNRLLDCADGVIFLIYVLEL